MINLYWFLAALFVLVGAFRVYLTVTDQHVYFHWQNTSDGKLPLWRDGRCWWRLSYNNEHKHHKYYPSPGINLSWYLWKLNPISLEFTQAAEETDIRIGIGFLIGRVWITLEGTRFFRWLYKDVYRMGWGYETEIALHLGYLGQYEFIIHFLYNDMSSGPSPRIHVPKWKWLYNHKRRVILFKRRWERSAKLINLRHLRESSKLTIDPLPSWFHFWMAHDFMKSMPTGGGWRLGIDFDRMIMGSYEREERQLEGSFLNVEVPIEPDNSLGLHYYGKFTRMEEVRWRGHFPWRKKVAQYWDIDFRNPPLHSGKGDNSWDQDDDGIFGCSSSAETLEGAIADYQAKCARDRERYGMPNVLYIAYEAHLADIREHIGATIRAVFRGESTAGTLSPLDGPVVKEP